MSTKHFMICVVLMITLCLSSIVAASGYSQAALDDEVVNLPDAPYFSRQFAGYINVFNHTNMFYWFVTAKNNPDTAPLLWWSSGGPGCSGLIGKLTEMGPYQPTSDGKGGAKLRLRDVTWNENYNIVYVEQPNVGFTNIDSGFAPREWTDAEIASRNADFMEAFFEKFSNFKGREFGISSESYGGHYIPTLARELIARINSGRSKINFKWSIVGNPLIYLPHRDFNQYKIQIEHQLIPRYPLGENYIKTCQPDLKSFPNPPAQRPAICDQYEQQMDAYVSRIDPYAMSFPICVNAQGNLMAGGHSYGDHIQLTIAKAQSTYRKRTLADTNALRQQIFDESRSKNTFDSLLGQIVGTPEEDYFPKFYQACEEDYTTIYLNRKDVQAALHTDLKRSRWNMCENVNYSDYDFIDSMLPVYIDNAKKGPQVQQLIFVGFDDTMCVEAQDLLFNNYKTSDVFWQDVEHKGQHVGHVTKFTEPNTLTFVTVSGSGHMVPSTSPKHGQVVIERFISGKL